MTAYDFKRKHETVFSADTAEESVQLMTIKAQFSENRSKIIAMASISA
ncbi:hypothetical protein ACFL2S_09310 [Thermodesulfobacteriota bacterium]